MSRVAELYRARRAQGLCAQCGKVPSIPYYCGDCAKNHRARVARSSLRAQGVEVAAPVRERRWHPIEGLIWSLRCELGA